MRKRKVIAGILLTLAVATMTACGGAKKDYLSDVQEINDFSVAVAEMEDVSEYSDAVTAMEMKTSEGKVIKEDMKKMADVLVEISGMDADSYDEDAVTELYNEMLEIQSEVETHIEDFTNAAEKSGVSDDDLEKMDLEL